MNCLTIFHVQYFMDSCASYGNSCPSRLNLDKNVKPDFKSKSQVDNQPLDCTTFV